MLSVASAAGMPGKARRHPDATRLSELQAVVLTGVGSRRMHRELRDRGYRIGLSDVERLMRGDGIRTRPKRHFKGQLRTPGTRCGWPTNMLDRRFSPPAPNKV